MCALIGAMNQHTYLNPSCRLGLYCEFVKTQSHNGIPPTMEFHPLCKRENTDIYWRERRISGMAEMAEMVELAETAKITLWTA